MIYEFVQAWKATAEDQYQAFEIDQKMPHYLRMLTYASQPDNLWGPAKDENRFGRYKPKKVKSTIEQSFSMKNSDTDDEDSIGMGAQNVYRVRL